MSQKGLFQIKQKGCQSLRVRPFFDHEIGFEMDFPVEDHADVKQAVFLNDQVGWKRMFVPAEKDAGGNGFNIHGRRLDDASVFRGVFDHFFMEHLVFAPAGHRVKFFEVIGVGRNMHVAPDQVRCVAVLCAGLEIFANRKLKEADILVGSHAAY